MPSVFLWDSNFGRPSKFMDSVQELLWRKKILHFFLIHYRYPSWFSLSSLYLVLYSLHRFTIWILECYINLVTIWMNKKILFLQISGCQFKILSILKIDCLFYFWSLALVCNWIRKKFRILIKNVVVYLIFSLHSKNKSV